MVTSRETGRVSKADKITGPHALAGLYDRITLYEVPVNGLEPDGLAIPFMILFRSDPYAMALGGIDLRIASAVMRCVYWLAVFCEEIETVMPLETELPVDLGVKAKALVQLLRLHRAVDAECAHI